MTLRNFVLMGISEIKMQTDTGQTKRNKNRSYYTQ